MDLFTIDTAGENDLFATKSYQSINNSYLGVKNSEDDSNSDAEEVDKDEHLYDYGGLPPPSVDVIDILKNPTLYNKPLYGTKVAAKSKQNNDLETFCKAMGWTWKDGELPTKPETEIKKRWWERRDEPIDIENVHKDYAKTNVAKEMAGGVTNGMEKKRSIELITDKKAAKLRKIENAKTRGKNWFNMPATEVSDELRQDMEIIQMRSVLNPTHFYKKNDLKTLPKYFQVGKVLPSALDRYNDRGERVNKKKSLVDELLQDAEFQQYNKRKYNEVMAEKSKSGYKKAYKKMKKLKKKS